VDNIITCLTKPAYTQQCIEAISKTGYVFTEQQVQKLCALGYMMIDVVKSMSYYEFLTLFDNKDFLAIFKANLDINNNYIDINPGKKFIDDKVKQIKDIRDKFKFDIEDDFVFIILTKCFAGYLSNSVSINIILNIHAIAKELDIAFTSQYFNLIISNYTNFYSEPSVTLDKITKFIGYYDNPITREFILDVINKTHSLLVFKAFMKQSYSSYDPMEDIFYIMYIIHENETQFNGKFWSHYLKHMLDNNYLRYDDFLLLLMYNVPEKKESTMSLILKEYLNKNNGIDNSYITNIYTFGNAASINILVDYKILPSIELIRMNIGYWNLEQIKGSSMFLDDVTEAYIDKLLLTNDNDNTEIMTPEISDIIEIYDSLNERDRQIMVRLHRNSILSLSNIIKYRIKITRKMLESMIFYGAWMSIVSLLFLDKSYDYIIDLLDIDMIIMAPSYHARIWLLENIYNESCDSLSLDNKFFGLQQHISDDEKELLKLPIVHNIKSYKLEIQKEKDELRRKYMTQLLEKNGSDSDKSI
jgi:hypothetical protein